MDAETTTVVIAAGHGVVGRVARRACEIEPGLEVVAEVRDETQLLEACRTLHPDVLVLDDRLEGGEPTLDTLRAVRDEGMAVAVVVLTDRVDGAAVLEALRLGVRGYVRKSDGLPGIGSVVRRVADGERAVDPELEQAAVMALGRFAQQAREGSEVEATLTARELEILAMVSRGLTMQQVGRRLGISPRTVETHVAKLYRKLGVRTRVQAVARAAELGLIDP
jgi:two-component system, NarL family, response regulator NreC